MSSQSIKAAIAGFVAMYLLSVLWYGMVISGYNTDQFMMVNRGAEDFSFMFITVGYALLAILLATAYPHGYVNGRSGSQGLRFGILMGLLIALPEAFIESGAFKFPLVANLVDAAYRVVEIGLGGLVIGRVYGSDVGKASD